MLFPGSSETRSRSCHIVPSGPYPFDMESRNETILVSNACGSTTQSLLYWPKPPLQAIERCPTVRIATGFREIQFAKRELLFARGHLSAASVPDCEWLGACRV